jgi:hypothetical protein
METLIELSDKPLEALANNTKSLTVQEFEEYPNM